MTVLINTTATNTGFKPNIVRVLLINTTATNTGCKPNIVRVLLINTTALNKILCEYLTAWGGDVLTNRTCFFSGAKEPPVWLKVLA